MTESTTATTPPPDTVTTGAARRDERGARRWWVLAVMSMAQLLITVDATIVNVALPEAQRALGFSDASRQWVITAYALAFGSLLLIGGRVADRLGRRRTLLIGLVLFGVGSALGGAAPGFGMLASARALQGVGGALLAPAALGTVTATFTARAERARAFSVFGTVGGMGAALGLLLGGVLTQDLDWRWTLYVNFVLAAVTLAATLLVVPADRPARARRIDTLGTALASTGLFGIVFGLSRAETDGWSAGVTWGTLIVSVLLLGAFIRRQTTAATPLVPLRIFADRNRAASLGALMMVNTGIFSAFLFLTYYLQQTLHYTPIKTGAAFLPIIGGTFVGSALALNLLPRFAGPRITIPIGMLTAAGSMLWLTTLNAHTGYAPVILLALTLLGLGVGLVFPVAINLATAGVHEDDHGVAGALVNTTQQIGGSIGVALLSTVSASATAHYLTAHAGARADLLQRAALHGYAVAYVISAAIFIAGGILAAIAYRSGVPDEVRNGQIPTA
ncbi:MFS transporter [Streptomyces sp. NPDC002766]|uniref:MFS transporter n=1 Tax=unclassified Streptomyces TaxID=2593676 RepID=UPI00331F4269